MVMGWPQGDMHREMPVKAFTNQVLLDERNHWVVLVGGKGLGY
jgi:hypothetical protein